MAGIRIRGSLQTGATSSGGGLPPVQRPKQPPTEARAGGRCEPAGISLALLLLVLLFLFMAGNIVPLNRVAEKHHSEYGDLIEAALYTAAALSLAYLPPFRSALRDHGWRRQPASCGWVVLLLLMLALPIVGGVFNRIRGGWRPLGTAGWMEDHSLSRLATVGVPNGVLVGAASGNPLLGVHFGIFSFLGALPGWGCYFGMAFGDSVGHPNDCAADPDRYGMFDWLVGKAHPPTHDAPPHDDAMAAVSLGHTLDGSAGDGSGEGGGSFAAVPWPFWKRYLRDFAGMGLRGLIWLLPPGLGMQSAGYGPLVLLCGALMPVIYTLCWIPNGMDGAWKPWGACEGKKAGDSFPCFGGGPALGELLWGITMWVMFLAALLPGKKKHSSNAQGGGGGGSPAIAPSGYVPITDAAEQQQAPRKGAAGCAQRMRSVLEVVAGVQLGLVVVATVVVAFMNHRADGR